MVDFYMKLFFGLLAAVVVFCTWAVVSSRPASSQRLQPYVEQERQERREPAQCIYVWNPFERTYTLISDFGMQTVSNTELVDLGMTIEAFANEWMQLRTKREVKCRPA